MNMLNKRFKVAVSFLILSLALSAIPAVAQTPAPLIDPCDLDGDGDCDGRDVVVMGNSMLTVNAPKPTEQATTRPTVAPSATSRPTGTARPSATARPTATATQAPTSAPAATSTPIGSATPSSTSAPVAGKPCPADYHDGEFWHPAVDPKTKCLYGHEHGDPPPQWVIDAVAMQHDPNMMHNGLSFNHAMNTSAAENSKKHSCMKGAYLANGKAAGPYVSVSWVQKAYPDLEIYLIYHGCANPPDRAARYHSMQAFAKDRTGAVSYWRYWVDTGNPAYYQDGGTRVETSAFDIPPNDTRPVVRVDWGSDTICEQWYMFGNEPRWLPDVGVTICDTPTAYSDIERRITRGDTKDADGAPLPDIYDTSWWPATGGHGAERNVEFVYYADPIIQQFLDKPIVIDQFGTPMTGFDDVRCGQPVVREGQTFTRLCSTMLIKKSLYDQMAVTTTFIKGQIAPREQHRYDVTGVGIAN